jgi:hypothetical protein
MDISMQNNEIKFRKFRYPSWWWGRFIFWDGKRWIDESGMVFPLNQVELSQMVEFDQSKHGSPQSSNS